MALLDYVLQAPTYGWERDGKLYKPSLKETFTEFFSRMNVFANRKNFLALFGWGSSLFLAVPLFIFLFNYLTWKLFIVGFIYSMVILGTHGTIWYHRYSTHRAYVFTNRF